MPAALALILAAASLGLARSQPQLPSVSKVCVENKGGFVLSFDLWNTANNVLSRRSRSYSSGQSCLELWTLGGVETGTPVVVVVHAEEGVSMSMPSLLYSPAADGGATANFACSGGTKTYSCTRDGEWLEAQPGALVPLSASQQQVSAKGVCVQNGGGFRMSFRLWDTKTGALGAWTNAFDQGGSACVDGDSLGGIASGHPLVLDVSVQGAYPASFRSILYDPDAEPSATFACSGWTAKYECSIQGASRRLQIHV